MQKLFGAVFLAAALMGAPRVSAQEINLSTMTCKDLFESNKDKVDFVVAWLLGYYTSDDDPPVFNFTVLKDTATKLGAYCAANPEPSNAAGGNPDVAIKWNLHPCGALRICVDDDS